MHTTRNQVMRHAFENLPQSVLGTEVGRLIFRVMQRNVANQQHNRGNRGRGKK